MSEREPRKPTAGKNSSLAQESAVKKEAFAEPVRNFIKSAVLGLGFGAVLFMVSDQTGLAEPLLRWLDLPGVGSHLGPKQLVIVGILLGVLLNVLHTLFRRTRHLLSNPVA
ncbi:MAG: hypothetical protein ABEK75_06735 [Salinibacter sp.]